LNNASVARVKPCAPAALEFCIHSWVSRISSISIQAMHTAYIPVSDLTRKVQTTELSFGSTTLAFPSPSPGWLGELAVHLTTAGEALRQRSTTEILKVLDEVNARWADLTSPERRESDATLAAVTGYPEAVIGPALDTMFAGLRRPHLEATLEEELSNTRALDTWIDRRELGTRSRAYGPRLTLVISSGNVPMAALPSMVYALLLKSPVLVKLSSEEPVLAGLYLRSLASFDESLGRASAAVWWPGGDEAIEEAMLPHADAVIAFGGDETLRSLGGRLATGTRFQPHGHRVGLGLIGKECLTRAGLPGLTEAAARDVAEFDQQGCVAPQRLFVESGGDVSPREFAAALAEALGRKAEEWPRRPPSPAVSATIHQLRAAAEVRATLDAEAALWASAGGTEWTVVLDPEPGFGPGCLHRTVTLHPVADLLEVLPRVKPLARYLQTAAVALSEEHLSSLVESLAEVGVTRICPLGRTQHPAPGWRPDGRPRLAELVRWVDREEEDLLIR
jgi:hypothetical protein